jgi:hypothetical protein
MAAKLCFHLADSRAQHLGRLGTASIAAALQQQSSGRPAAQADDHRLIALADLVVHPAEFSISIASAHWADFATGQVDVDEHRAARAHQSADLFLHKRLSDGLQSGLHSAEGLLISGGQGAAERGIMSKGFLPPTAAQRVVVREWMRRVTKIVQVVQPSQDGDEELDELGLRGVVDGALGDGDVLQAGEQAEFMSELTQDHLGVIRYLDI